MKNVFFIIAIYMSSIANALDNQETDAALSWLKVVDSGQYIESWQQAAPYFQEQLSSSAWEQALNQVRAPLGKVISRQVKNSSQHSSLPGAPTGEYIVITTVASFEHKQSAVETITISKVGNEWRAVGYFIK